MRFICSRESSSSLGIGHGLATHIYARSIKSQVQSNDSVFQSIFLYRITSVQAEVTLSHFVAKPFNASHGALYRLFILHMLPASVHSTNVNAITGTINLKTLRSGQ